MNDNKINKDPLVSSLFEEAGAEQPSTQFADKIMHQIHGKSMKSVFVYKPVISRKAWILMAFCGLAIIVYLLTGNAGEVQPKDVYGFSLQIDTTFIAELLKKFTAVFASPILKASVLAFAAFAFANQLILYWKSRSMTN